MRVTFLEAEVPLTKTFSMRNGQLEKIGHPRVIDYTSHEAEFETIEELHRLLTQHAKQGHCFLKGNLIRPLVNESRAGTTNPNEPTRILLYDFDGAREAKSLEELLGQLKCLDVDHIVQYSSSMGVVPERGISAHVFVLLDREYTPGQLKQFLMHLNLTVPTLRANLGLTRTNNALRWPLDVSTCQNDKLIYIAPPICLDGVKDSFKGERIALVKGKHRTLSIDQGSVPALEVVQKQAHEALNQLRAALGLEARTRTSLKLRAGVEYMAKPDSAVVTGLRADRGFVYLNLNGGDSWGYYHPVNNPEFIYNFKGEPTYRTQELLPDYWAEVRAAPKTITPDADGRIYLTFREFYSSAYYNGYYDTQEQLLDIAQAKNDTQLRHFLMQHNQPVPEFFTDWKFVFDPQRDEVIDVEQRFVNKFVRTKYMKAPRREVRELPPTVRKVALNMCGGDEEALERFLNWLAVILQYRCKTGTAWIFHGVPGTGKGMFLSHVLRPLLGKHVESKRMRELDSQFNGFLEHTLVLWIDEAEQNEVNSRGSMNADIKNYITELRISIRRMYTNPYEADSYVNLILASNMGHIAVIDLEDRRFNVAPYQTQPLVMTDEEVERIREELDDTYQYFMTRTADRGLARTPLRNAAKEEITRLNRTALNTAVDAIKSGDLQYFLNQRPQKDLLTVALEDRERTRRYDELMDEIVRTNPSCLLREELYDMLNYVVGNMPTTPAKFSALLKHSQLIIQPVRRDGKVYRGVPTKWAMPENS